MKWLSRRSVLLKDFKEYALSLTEQVREETKKIADTAQCPVIYLQSSKQSKEDLAKQIAATNGVREGLVCVLTSVEQCQTFTVGPNAKTKHLELRPLQGKCLHQYFYYLHPAFQINGFGNRDLRPLLFDQPASVTTVEGHRQSARVTRLLQAKRAGIN